MSVVTWAYLLIVLSLGTYAIVSWASRMRRSKGFYMADIGLPPIFTGMAMATDRIGAATFLSLAGVFFVAAPLGVAYVLGWLGGFFLLAILLGPYLRKLLTFTIPDFVGARYYSESARLVAVVCMMGICVLLLGGQIRGVGIVLSRLTETGLSVGILGGLLVALAFAVVAGSTPSSRMQVIQCVILLAAYLITAAALSGPIAGLNGPAAAEPGKSVLEILRDLNKVLPAGEVTIPSVQASPGVLDCVAVAAALMLGTCAIPNVLAKFFTEPNLRAARFAVVYSLLLVALIYITAPAVAAFTRYNLVTNTLNGPLAEGAAWIKSWEPTGLVVRTVGDKRAPGPQPNSHQAPPEANDSPVVQEQKPEESRAASETSQAVVRIHPDVIAVASPEIAGLPGWIGGLFLAAALTAALSGAAALLAVLGAFVSYDIYLRLIDRHASVKRQRTVSQVSMCLAVILAGGLALYVRASVAQLVAWGFGVGAATFFPVLVLGVFWKRATTQGAMAGMVFGAVLTMLYIIHVSAFDAGPWLFGISAEGVGAVAAVLSLIVTVAVSLRTPRPPGEIQELVQRLHYSPDVTTTREFG